MPANGVRPQIPLSSVCLSERETGYVNRALQSGWISGTGSYVGEFERLLADRLQSRMWWPSAPERPRLSLLCVPWTSAPAMRSFFLR